MIRLGVVSFLNSRPLIAGLARDPRVAIQFAVPAQLPALLDAGAVDAALIPTIDILQRSAEYAVISDACIACDGETMTVRVFSQVPPDRVRALAVDPDSHTSVALARILWQELYGRALELYPLAAREHGSGGPEAVLLIGDKVVDPQRGSFAYEVDLGGAWRAHTGLPFVFALWARRRAEGPEDAAVREEIAALLGAARDRGVAEAARIASRDGPAHGWPIALAERYLTRCLRFRLDERARAGVQRFEALCRNCGVLPRDEARLGAGAPGLPLVTGA